MSTLKDMDMAVDRMKRIEHKLDKVAEFLEDSFLTKEEEDTLREIRDIVGKGELHKLKDCMSFKVFTHPKVDKQLDKISEGEKIREKLKSLTDFPDVRNVMRI